MSKESDRAAVEAAIDQAINDAIIAEGRAALQEQDRDRKGKGRGGVSSIGGDRAGCNNDLDNSQ